MKIIYLIIKTLWLAWKAISDFIQKTKQPITKQQIKFLFVLQTIRPVVNTKIFISTVDKDENYYEVITVSTLTMAKTFTNPAEAMQFKIDHPEIAPEFNVQQYLTTEFI